MSTVLARIDAAREITRLGETFRRLVSTNLDKGFRVSAGFIDSGNTSIFFEDQIARLTIA